MQKTAHWVGLISRPTTAIIFISDQKMLNTTGEQILVINKYFKSVAYSLACFHFS